MTNLKFAILGCGHIATKMAMAVKTLENKSMGVELYAAAARDLSKAENFAKQYGVAKAYGSYEELAADKDVDLIYIATPHSHHYEHAKLCIAAGKNLLVEKAFCANAKQAAEIIAMAKEKGTFLCEAMWTRFLPAVQTVREWIAADRIGEVQCVEADFSMSLTHIERLVNPALAGGALLDLGIYCLTFADLFLSDGAPFTDLDAHCIKTASGVDATDWINITYKNGKKAYLKTSITDLKHNEGTIHGTKGRIRVINLNDMEELQVYDEAGALVESVKPERICNCYEYEVLGCKKAIKEIPGHPRQARTSARDDTRIGIAQKDTRVLECAEMPLSKTLEMMELMDSIREQFGISYPFEIAQSIN